MNLGAASTGLQVRHAARRGDLLGHTSGLAMDYVQGNLVVLPAEDAAGFLRYCQRNPKPCPVLAVSEPGVPLLPELALDLDVRTDLPRYRVWRDGHLHEEPSDLSNQWQDDFVSIVIGCSFSFEHALISAGIVLRNVAQGKNVAMYKTNIRTQSSGPYAGPLVVSMRPMLAADAILAVQITGRLPQVHGAPVHIGNPALIGIADLATPDYGDAVEVRDDELPVFWACGVTPQAVIAAARLPCCITHAPGAMLVTDQLNSRLSI